jgi:subtilisin-like proprotein convertase family protein
MKRTLGSFIAANRRTLLFFAVLASLTVFGMVSMQIDAQKRQEKVPTNDPPAPSAPDPVVSRGPSIEAPAAVFAANAGSLGAIPDSPAGGNLCGDYASAPLDVTFTVPAGAITGPLTDVRLDFTSNPAHTFVGDLRVTLIAPSGAATHTIFAQTTSTTPTGCGDSSDVAGPYNFFDTAPATPTWWEAATTAGSGVGVSVPAGNYRTSTPGGAAGGGANALMTPTFAGLSTAQIAGTWTARFHDGGQGDTGAISAANLTLTGTAGNPACLPVQTTVSNNTPAPISSTGTPTVTSTVVVANAGPYLAALRVRTFITHTFPGEIDMTLTSPAGTVVTLTTDNGGTMDNIFNGTLWTDAANPFGQVPYVNNAGLVTDQAHAINVVSTPLVPEEGFDAFRGENPNGTWTLTIGDDADGDGGSLNSWSLEAYTTTAPTLTGPTTFANATPVVIPSAGTPTVTSTVNVAGMTGPIETLDVFTNITHTFNSDLDITIQAPSGKTVTLTTDNGGITGNGFAGTLWDSDADPGNPAPFPANNFAASNMVTDTVFVAGAPRSPLTPEESLGAFKGEQPNGIWTITISDDADLDGGTLNSWELRMTTNGCPLPSAAGVEVSGRLTTSIGKGLRGAKVTLSNQAGSVLQTVVSGENGVYRFSNVEVGQTYLISVGSRRYTFTPRLIQVFDNISDADLTADP